MGFLRSKDLWESQATSGEQAVVPVFALIPVRYASIDARAAAP